MLRKIDVNIVQGIDIARCMVCLKFRKIYLSAAWKVNYKYVFADVYTFFCVDR